MFFMMPIEERKLLPHSDFVAIFGDLVTLLFLRLTGQQRAAFGPPGLQRLHQEGLPRVGLLI
jgi:hypothetical protein